MRPALVPVSDERERAMQSTFSVAAMILAIVGGGEVKMSGEGDGTQIRTTDAVYVAGWNAPDPLWKNAFFGMPRMPRPRLPR
jgi:hypothetical protein